MTDTLKPTEAATAPFRVASDVLEMLRVVAFRRRQSLADLVDPVLRPFAEAEFKAVVKEIDVEVSQIRQG